MKKRVRVRPAQFCESDEQAICRLVWRIYEDVSSDLFSAYGGETMNKCHVHDFMDCFANQLGRHHRLIPTEVAIVARDAEREQKPELAAQVRASVRGEIAADVYNALLRYDDPHHAWAMSVAEQHMRKQADKRGYLHP